MAVGPILTVLSNIPWGTVVENAPKIADGASRLWSAVTRRKVSGSDANGDAKTAQSNALSENNPLAGKVREMEAEIQNLNEQMQLSSALIKDLAEQNTLLVQRVELNRLRFVRTVQTGSCVVLVLSSAVAYLLIADA